MTEGLVTVVIPVYNVEKYLDRCLDSVVTQTYEKIEIILVDDKSPDSSPQKCDEWKKKDSRIKVIHKNVNEGLGEARNTGIRKASGEYICFVDSDDYIDNDMIEYTYSVAKQCGADIVHYGFKLMDYDLNNKGLVIAKNSVVYKAEKIYKDFIPNMIAPDPVTGNGIGLWMSLCGSLISMRLIRNVQWTCASEREIISEDMYSLLYLYNFVKTAAVTDKAFYYYCENSSSLTHIYRKDRFNKIKKFYKSCQELCAESGYDEKICHRINTPFLNYTLAALKQLVEANLKWSDKLMIIKKIYKDDLLREVIVQNKNDKINKAKRVFYWTIMYDHYYLGYICLKLKNKF